MTETAENVFGKGINPDEYEHRLGEQDSIVQAVAAAVAAVLHEQTRSEALDDGAVNLPEVRTIAGSHISAAQAAAFESMLRAQQRVPLLEMLSSLEALKARSKALDERLAELETSDGDPAILELRAQVETATSIVPEAEEELAQLLVQRIEEIIATRQADYTHEIRAVDACRSA